MSQWKMASEATVQATMAAITIQIGDAVPSTEIATIVWAAAGVAIAISAIWTYITIQERREQRKERDAWKAQMKAIRDEQRRMQKAKKRR